MNQIATDELTHKGTSKIAHYKWTVVDKPGAYIDLPKGVLTVDDAYQREEHSEDKITAMASAWSWIGCGTIIVGHRGDRYHVIDGQNRVLAARKRTDIGTLPCLVFKTRDVEQEAAGFIAANTKRKPISAVDRHRALICLHDVTANFVQALIEESGRRASKSSSSETIACVSRLNSLARTSPNALVAVWPLIIDVCKGHAMHDRLVAGLVFIESHLPDGDTLMTSRWRKRICNVGFERILAGIQKAAAIYARGSDKIFAEGALGAINYGSRNKLALR